MVSKIFFVAIIFAGLVMSCGDSEDDEVDKPTSGLTLSVTSLEFENTKSEKTIIVSSEDVLTAKSSVDW
jgi:hypothetical protein